MRKIRTHYSPDFKLKAVELSNDRGSVVEVAKELNISKYSLQHWKKAYANGKLILSGSVIKAKHKDEEELIRLRKDLYDVKMERDILKKALGIFSKSDK